MRFDYLSGTTLLFDLPILAGRMAGLFENTHIPDLLGEGCRPTEIDEYYEREKGRRWDWQEGAGCLLNPEEEAPIRWRDGNNGIRHIVFFGVCFTHREWQAGNHKRRKANARFRWELRLAASRSRELPSFTRLLELRAKEEYCAVAKFLQVKIWEASYENRPEVVRWDGRTVYGSLTRRWDGKLDLLREPLEAQQDSYWRWVAGPIPPADKWQGFWEWWTRVIHPRL